MKLTEKEIAELAEDCISNFLTRETAHHALLKIGINPALIQDAPDERAYYTNIIQFLCSHGQLENWLTELSKEGLKFTQEWEIIDNITQVMDLSKKYQDQALQQSILELREKILVLREENLKLKENLMSLQKQKEIEDVLIRVGNLYYKRTDEKKEHPYCMTCWDYDNKLVSVILYNNITTGNKCFRCTVCNARKNK